MPTDTNYDAGQPVAGLGKTESEISVVRQRSNQSSEQRPFIPEPVTFDYIGVGQIRNEISGQESRRQSGFKSQSKSRHPIPFAEVKGDSSFAVSDSLLFNVLPLEILTMVIDFLPIEVLEVLASVSRDCYILARTRLFEKLDLGSHPAGLDILGYLHKQTFESRSRMNTLYLGNCVRRLTVSTLSRRWSLHTVINVYLPKVLNVIQYGLPNLDSLKWSQPVTLTASAWQILLESPIRRLKLYNILINASTFDQLRGLPPAAGRSLEELHIGWDVEPKRGVLFCYNCAIELLIRCAPKLTTLVWHGSSYSPARYGGELRKAGPLTPMFNLRSLALNGVYIQTPEDIAALMGPTKTSKLAHLSLNQVNEAVIRRLRLLGRLPMLQSFVWGQDSYTAPLCVDFLSQNPQIEFLSLKYCPKSLIDDVVLPLLATDFRRLRSLELRYDRYDNSSSTLSDAALTRISQLISLTQLHVEIGPPTPTYGLATWMLDHDKIRACVEQLPKLKTLALSGDTYDPHNTGLRFVQENYYYRSFTHGTNGWESHDRSPSFESTHLERMLKQGNEYVSIRNQSGPKLDFVYCGQIPMRVETGSAGCSAVPATNGRDSLTQFLRKTFRTGNALNPSE
ncbi:uncharacterized protein AB675_11254 [Cyphellophora attinorum]|uniref:F-box domain-containing protein n=1 Tax=Cyphellophora attinorum TaxID=1664694 RepID=A0A0N0NM55_9EURO|nr:uncharacterized protein AB675_11254 [Phialophora attinorum]KPI39958.1 hypothetical protein AB675_11254 [Phialophora attinorum]